MWRTANGYGVTRERIRQVEAKALKQLRETLNGRRLAAGPRNASAHPARALLLDHNSGCDWLGT